MLGALGEDMQQIITYLNGNVGALNALFTGVVAISTVVYAALTWRLVSETRRMRDIQTEPKVIVTYKSREEWAPLLDLIIKNIGLGPALDIRFSVAPTTNSLGAQILLEELSGLSFLKNGVAFLGPNDVMRSYFTNVNQSFEQKIAAQLSVAITYRSGRNRRYTDRYIIDLSELSGLRMLGKPPLHKIADYLEKIERNLDQLATGFSRLKVATFDTRDREEEKTREEEYIKDLTKRNDKTEAKEGT
jgi:hypothetical protein